MIEGMDLTLLSLSEKDWNNYGKFWDDSLFNDRKYGNKMAISDLAILLGGDYGDDSITVPDDSSLRGRTGEYHIVDILREYEQEDEHEEEYEEENDYSFNEFTHEYGYGGSGSSMRSNYLNDNFEDDDYVDDGWHVTLDDIEYYMSENLRKNNDAIRNENPITYHEEYNVLYFSHDGIIREIEELYEEYEGNELYFDYYFCIRPVLDLSALSSSDYFKICQNRFDGYNGVQQIEFGEYPQYAPDSSTIEILNDKYDDDELKTTGRTFTFVKREVYADGSCDYVIDEVEEYEYNGKKYILLEDFFAYGCKLSNGTIMRKDSAWLEVSPVQWLIDDKNKRLISKIGLYAGIEDKKDSFCPPFKNNNAKKFLDEYMIKDLFQSTSLFREIDTVEDENEHSNENKTTEKKKELEELKNVLLQQTMDNSSLTNGEKGRPR